ncbi:MAG: vitamin K epoxide reductase family protein [Verrucomicrobiota bacterium]
MSEDGASEKPPGWSYNPSTWGERIPLMLVALSGFCIAGYLASYQWRIVKWVWDPFFPTGSQTVLNSPISTLLPIPDAAVGALGYLVDVITGVIGGTSRWRTMPWIVVCFGFAVGPLGLVSLLLVILQPVKYQAWCSLCLSSAFISILMIGPAMDEVLASLQYLRHQKDKTFWRAFWGLE